MTTNDQSEINKAFLQWCILPGVTLWLSEAGHILGSSIVELWLDSGADTVEPVFSGDLGRSGMPILQAPVSVPRVDLVIMESTCRDCVHRSWPHTLQEFGEVLNGAPS